MAEHSPTTTDAPARPGATRRRVVFGLVLFVVTSLLFWVPYFGLFAPGAEWPTPVVVVGTAVFALGYLAFPVLLIRSLGSRHSDRAARIGLPLLGVAWIAFSWTLITDVLRLVLAVAGVENPFRARFIAVLLAVIVVGLAGYGHHVAMRVPKVRRAEVVLRRLDPAFDGLTVAVLADTHYGPIDRTKWSQGLVAAVNELDADVVVHVGDIADGTVEQRRGQSTPLGGVRAGHRFYVSGNHEYLSNAQAWMEHMDELGWTSLHNRHRVLEREGARLVFAGIDDITAVHSGEEGHAADLDAALAGVGADDPVVLLAHQPSEVRTAAAAGVDLQLSGHTHGGQIWPFHLLVRLQQPVLQGLSDHGTRTRLWTSRGAGFWGPPFRVFAPNEISLLTLRSR
ncbi:metallophosphoesterase [Actinosynnema sp. NPDC047251]|uniref:Metallophosphoesterase n=1 Tax=Saccharothrix espanaensis (strain ATCC 51144 / DSM 44229 / JCM 9112 / NBRC 15066 / NRRL 15764) TaxID=1179773 RepID=K0JZX7_SACES|nr:metallophosphoesterase [Saccharothrix espanaensis]CCH30862.1 Metallophosphoesterase [Saccharothrix espanaensis DSM 44229]